MISHEPSPRSTSRFVIRPQTAGHDGVVGQGGGRRIGRAPSSRAPLRCAVWPGPRRASPAGGCTIVEAATSPTAVRKMIVPMTLTCGGMPIRACGVDQHREGDRVAGREVGDDEVVDRQAEREQRGGHDAGQDERERDLARRWSTRWRRGPSPPPRGAVGSPARRARTVTTTKLMLNMMWAIRIGDHAEREERRRRRSPRTASAARRRGRSRASPSAGR